MTRARRIEAALLRWFEPLNWIEIDSGSAKLTASVWVSDELTHRPVEETFSIADLAAELDAEFDRIAKETT